MKYSKEKNTGITLIALVITIIVLLILAGVTVATLTGDNGLLGKAGQAQNANKESIAREKIQVEVAGSFNLTGEIDLDLLNTNLSKIKGLTYEENEISSTNRISKLSAIVRLDDYNFIIEGNGIIKKINFISEQKNYTGYYADINKDGIVDGIIFVDLVAGSSKEKQQWEENSAGYGNKTTYSISKLSDISEVKKYYTSEDKYKLENETEEKPIIYSTGSGLDRFYIMSLNDFTTEEYIDEKDSNKNYPAYTTYHYFKNAYGKMYKADTFEGLGEGKTNTKIMIEKWNLNGITGEYDGATQDNRDIWKHIQDEADEGWFIPSREEWSAFANELNITKENYNTIYNLNNRYMSSTRFSYYVPYWINFTEARMDGNYFGNGATWCVRLATTF